MLRRSLLVWPLLLPAFFCVVSHEDVFRLDVAFGEGENKSLSISAPAVRSSPSWDPEVHPEPVLSMGSATRVARDWLSKALKSDEYRGLKLVDSCKYVITKVSLERFEDEKWLYEIQFEETNREKIGWSGGEHLRVDIWVDMNGRVWVPASSINKN